MTGLEEGDAAGAQHSYFVPMVDMLAGVVFILVILLASVTLVSRQDFSEAQAAQAEMTDIQRRLEAARELDRRVLEPRRDAQAALDLLLKRLRDDLARRGIAVSIDPRQGRLELAAGSLFAGDRGALSPAGDTTAAALAGALASELPCLASSSAPRPPRCADYRAARLDRAVVAVSGGDGEIPTSDLRALGVLDAMAKSEPAILALTSPDGDRLVAYRAFAPMPAAEPSVRLVLAFQMDVPPLPPAGG